MAVLLCGVYWRTFFGNILPKGTYAVVVLENTCGQVYSYKIEGFDAKFLGFGDLHDPKYHHLGGKSSFFGHHGLNNSSCQYRVCIYPTRAFEDLHVTSTPIKYAVALASVLIFTSVVFFLYDKAVQHRQQVVLTAANRSGAIVSSLFPEEVHDRLYEVQDQKTNTNEENEIVGEAAIANLYPNCSILFMDIAGFTQFSAPRSPTEVFELLETIYAAFDKIAYRKKVFKVEVRRIRQLVRVILT